MHGLDNGPFSLFPSSRNNHMKTTKRELEIEKKSFYRFYEGHINCHTSFRT